MAKMTADGIKTLASTYVAAAKQAGSWSGSWRSPYPAGTGRWPSAHCPRAAAGRRALPQPG